MSAQSRVELSRAKLRDAMLPDPPSPTRTLRARSLSWWERLKKLPGVGFVVEAVSAWWSRHPLRPVAEVAREASNQAVKPIAQRHPLAIVAAGGLLGAAIGWRRPSRWIFRSVMFAAVLPKLISRVSANLPVESWMRRAESRRASTAGAVTRSVERARRLPNPVRDPLEQEA